jgi:hypothetical protein
MHYPAVKTRGLQCITHSLAVSVEKNALQKNIKKKFVTKAKSL